MVDTYTFKVVLGSSGDEFSETFNPKNDDDCLLFEENLKNHINDYQECKSIKLIEVITKFEW